VALDRQTESFLLEVRIFGELRRTVSAQLDADVPKTTLDVLLDAGFERRQVFAAGVAVTIHGKTAFAAKQLIDGHAGAFAFDVPKRLVKPAQGVVQDGPIPPIRTGVSGLPDVFDVVGVATAAERVEVFLDGNFHREWPLIESRATQAVQPWLARLDLYNNKPDSAVRGGQDETHFRNLERRELNCFWRRCLREGHVVARQKGQERSGAAKPGSFDHLASVHNRFTTFCLGVVSRVDRA